MAYDLPPRYMECLGRRPDGTRGPHTRKVANVVISLLVRDDDGAPLETEWHPEIADDERFAVLMGGRSAMIYDANR